MALIIAIKVILFFSILTFFGWHLIRFVLREARLEFLLPLSISTGIIFYIFLLNTFGYFFDITSVYLGALAVILIASVALWLVNRKKEKARWSLDRKWKKIFLITTLLIFLSTGIVATRSFTADEISIFSTIPVAATISEGNFPVYWVVNPEVKAYDHYGVELFSAGLLKTTGLPLLFGVDSVRAIFTASFFALLFALLLQITKSQAKSYLVSLMTLFGGGLTFLQGFKGVEVFYKIFILGEQVAAPWKFIHLATTYGVAGPLIRHVHIQWDAISFFIILSGIWLYFRIVEIKKDGKNLYALGALLITVIFLSVLALIGETFLLIMLGIFLIYPFFMLLFKEKRKDFKNYFLVSIILSGIVFIIAVFQGGVLTELFQQNYDRHPRISSNWFFFNYHQLGYIWSKDSLINFGLVLVLIIPGLYLLYTKFKRKAYSNEILQLILLSCVSFAVPFVIELGAVYDYEMARFLYLAPPFWTMVLGLIFADLIINNPRTKKWLRRLIYLVILLMTLTGILFQLIFMILPIGRLRDGLSPFFFSYPRPGQIEQGAYDWIKDNTSSKNLIWSYSLDDIFSAYNKKLVVFTGRMAPQYDSLHNHGFLNRDARTEELVSEYIKLEQSCESRQMKNLNYSYLYVNPHWPEGLEEKCLSNNTLELVYEDSKDSEFARIYKVAN